MRREGELEGIGSVGVREYISCSLLGLVGYPLPYTANLFSGLASNSHFPIQMETECVYSLHRRSVKERFQDERVFYLAYLGYRDRLPSDVMAVLISVNEFGQIQQGRG